MIKNTQGIEGNVLNHPDPVSEALGENKELSHLIHKAIQDIKDRCERYMIPSVPDERPHATIAKEGETPLISALIDINIESEKILNSLQEIRNRLM
jgi:hypothetical protein